MDTHQLLEQFWQAIAAQDAQALAGYFTPNATIRWHCTNECFTPAAFIRANCEYPGDWDGKVERLELLGSLAVTATRVWLRDSGASFHVVSFFGLEGNKIATLDEYWGDDGEVPAWRQALGLG